jgi:membrane protease YdiL (CAAX protease family)
MTYEKLKPVVILTIVAGIFWFWMFSPWTKGFFSFWPVMCLATGILAGSAMVIDGKSVFRSNHKLTFDIAIGLISAVGLYAIFFIGKHLSEFILPFAGGQIGRVYETRAQGNLWIVGTLLLFWIGPAEEIFWRGFVQRRLGQRYGLIVAFAQTLVIYTLVHIWSFNLMLLAAAFICGFVWGSMYWIFGSIRPGLISHAVWDVLIFVLFPLN